MTAGAAHVELIRRTNHPIFYIIEDRWSDSSCVYIGMTPLFTTTTAESKWQIERQTYDGSKIVTEFGNHGKWNCVWDNRASYFGPSGGVPFPGMVISGTVTYTQQGLHIAGKITLVTLSAIAWTALPPVPLANRNAMGIQNQSGTAIKLEYDNSIVTWDGVLVNAGGERYYDVTDAIPVYAKAELGTPIILVEELS